MVGDVFHCLLDSSLELFWAHTLEAIKQMRGTDQGLAKKVYLHSLDWSQQ
jgi:hypothetical protein